MAQAWDIEAPATTQLGGEAHYRLLFETMIQGVLCLDAEGRITDANPAAERILGLGAGEMLGRSPAELPWRATQVDGSPFPDDELPFAVALRSGERVRGVILGIHHGRSGECHWVRVDVTPHVRMGECVPWQAIAALTDVTEERETQVRLREGEARFRLLAEQATDLISRHRADGTFSYASPSSRSLLGYEPEELLNRRPCEFIHPEDQAEVRHAHAMVMSQPAGFTVCYRFRKKDGSHLWCETTSRVVTNPGSEGEPTLHAVTRDVSRRKRAEEALRASEERLRTVMANIPMVLFALDRDGVFTVSEGRGLASLGLAPGEVVGASVYELYRSQPSILASVRRALTGQEVTAEHEIVDRVFRTWYSPMRREEGPVEGVIGVAVDISTQRRVDAELRTLSSAVEQSPASVVITDPAGTIEYVNTKFEQVTGYTREEVVGRKPNLLKSGNMTTEFYASLWQQVRAGKEWRGEFHNRRKNGELFWESAVITPIKEESGQVRHYLAVKEDITERKRAEETRARLEAQLRESQKLEAFGQLAGGVAHDFNNILTVIQSHACLLQEGMLSESEAREAVREIARSAERASNLTAQLLAFSRRQVMQPRDLDLNEVLANMSRMLQRLIGEHIALEARYAPGNAPVHADAGMMEQVILNLAVNARDAMPRGGRLLLSTEWVALAPGETGGARGARAGDFVRLNVTDTGCGIPPEVLPRIFEPFFTTKDIGKGTGLGLSTVLGIVEQHHGWVEVQSVVGQGTTFRVHLPRLDRPLQSPPRPPLVTRAKPGNETILVVEDEPPLRMMVRAILERQGYRVLEAGSGREAVAIWEQHRPHIQLMLTDLVLPEGMTGVEVAQQIQSQDPAMRVVFTSGYSEDTIETRFLRRGAKFLPKPYDPLKLIQVMRDCLDAK